MTGQSPPMAAGTLAAQQGEPLTVCPYSPGTPEGRAWHHGWTGATWDRENESSAAFHRTMQQRREAHRLAAEWEPNRYGTNPVDDLCREVGEAGAPQGFMEMARQACRDAGLDPDARVSLPWFDPDADPLGDLVRLARLARDGRTTVSADPYGLAS